MSKNWLIDIAVCAALGVISAWLASRVCQPDFPTWRIFLSGSLLGGGMGTALRFLGGRLIAPK